MQQNLFKKRVYITLKKLFILKFHEIYIFFFVKFVYYTIRNVQVRQTYVL